MAGLLAIGFGTLINPLDTSVNIAFPDITRAFALPLPSIQWIVIAYVLTYAGLMLTFGKLGDLYGHRRIFGWGLAISAVSFVLCGLAETYPWLLLARVLQGIGTALVVSVGPALATALFPEQQRLRVLGFYTMMYGFGAAVGPLAGGLLIGEWGWAAVFWFRLPVALAALAMIGLLPPHARTDRPKHGFDILGAVLLMVGMTALLLALNRARDIEANWPLVLGFAILATVSLGGFIRQELRAPDPIIRVGVFRRNGFGIFNMACGVTQLASFTILLFVPYFLVRTSALPLWLAGIVLATSPLGLMAGGPLASWLSRLVNSPRLAFGAAVATGLALLPQAAWDADTALAVMALTLFLHGAALGCFQTAYLDVVTSTLPRNERGVAGSLAMATRTAGIMIGAAGMTIVFSVLENGALGGGATPSASFLAAFQGSFAAAGFGLLAFLALTMLRPHTWRQPIEGR